jgi:hypothetical protein
MSAHWKHLIVEITIWLAAEVLLNVTGLDNLADFSEFMEQQLEAVTPQPTLTQSQSPFSKKSAWLPSFG